VSKPLRSHQRRLSAWEALGSAPELSGWLQGAAAGRTHGPPGQRGARRWHCLGAGTDTLPAGHTDTAELVSRWAGWRDAAGAGATRRCRAIAGTRTDPAGLGRDLRSQSAGGSWPALEELERPKRWLRARAGGWGLGERGCLRRAGGQSAPLQTRSETRDSPAAWGAAWQCEHCQPCREPGARTGPAQEAARGRGVPDQCDAAQPRAAWAKPHRHAHA